LSEPGETVEVVEVDAGDPGAGGGRAVEGGDLLVTDGAAAGDGLGVGGPGPGGGVGGARIVLGGDKRPDDQPVLGDGQVAPVNQMLARDGHNLGLEVVIANLEVLTKDWHLGVPNVVSRMIKTNEKHIKLNEETIIIRGV